jgi:hypothetical protein
MPFTTKTLDVYLKKAQAYKLVLSVYSLPDSVGKIHGNGKSDLEDLALPNRFSREADEIGRRVCLST